MNTGTWTALAVAIGCGLFAAQCAPGADAPEGAEDSGADAAAERPAEAPGGGLAGAPEGAPAEAGGAAVRPAALPPLPELFDCVREAGGVLVAAHRGGPAPGRAENGMLAMERAFAAGAPLLEIDVATSPDGVQYLMHDRTLDRTTTGGGNVSDTPWPVVRGLTLVDADGRDTGEPVPTLSDALAWAVEAGAVLELDRKGATRFADLVAAVREQGAENNVVMITYNDEQAAELAGLAPELMLTASAYGARDIDTLIGLGVDPSRLIAWTGTDGVEARAWARLREQGVEPAFGTLGRPGQRLDDLWAADGDLSEYRALGPAGLVLLATDAPLAAMEAMDADDRARESCLPQRG